MISLVKSIEELKEKAGYEEARAMIGKLKSIAEEKRKNIEDKLLPAGKEKEEAIKNINDKLSCLNELEEKFKQEKTDSRLWGRKLVSTAALAGVFAFGIFTDYAKLANKKISSLVNDAKSVSAYFAECFSQDADDIDPEILKELYGLEKQKEGPLEIDLAEEDSRIRIAFYSQFFQSTKYLPKKLTNLLGKQFKYFGAYSKNANAEEKLGPGTYKVKNGDTLYKLGREHYQEDGFAKYGKDNDFFVRNFVSQTIKATKEKYPQIEGGLYSTDVKGNVRKYKELEIGDWKEIKRYRLGDIDEGWEIVIPLDWIEAYKQSLEKRDQLVKYQSKNQTKI